MSSENNDPRLSHPDISQPDNLDGTIWRYMDLPKYVSLLATRCLWYSQVAELPDVFEGSLPPQALKIFEDRDQERIDAGQRIVAERPGIFSIGRYFVYANCWCMHEKESNALWRIYGGDGGVAIQSTYPRLYQSIPQDHFVGKVRYIDYDADVFSPYNIMAPAFYKRKFFEYEHEIRAIYFLPSDFSSGKSDDDPTQASTSPNTKDRIDFPGPKGLARDTNIELLVESVVISPYAPLWLCQCVSELTSRFGYSFPVRQSDMSKKPYHHVERFFDSVYVSPQVAERVGV